MKRIILIALGTPFLAGCPDQGPMERTGEEIDEAIEDIRNGGETIGNRLDDAVDEVRDAAEDIRDDLDN